MRSKRKLRGKHTEQEAEISLENSMKSKANKETAKPASDKPDIKDTLEYLILEQSAMERLNHERLDQGPVNWSEIPELCFESDGETNSEKLISNILAEIEEVDTLDLKDGVYKNKILSGMYFELGFQISIKDNSSDSFMKYYENMQKAIDLNPYNARAQHHLAFCYRVFGRKKAEIAHLKHVLELEPENLDAASVLHDIYLLLNRKKDADKIFGKEKRKKHSSPLTQQYLEAIIQKDASEFTRLHEEKKVEVAKASNEAKHYHDLALIEKILAEKESGACTSKALFLHHKIHFANAYLLNPYLREDLQDKIFPITELAKVCKQPARAKRLLKSLATTKYHPELHYLLGEYFGDRGKKEEAKKHLDAAIKKASKNQNIYNAAIDSMFAFMIEEGKSAIKSFKYLLQGHSAATIEKLKNLQDKIEVSDEEISRYGYEMIISRNDFATLTKIKDADQKRHLFPHLIDTPFILEVLVDITLKRGLNIDYDKRIALHLAALLHDIERIDEAHINKKSYGLGKTSYSGWYNTYRKRDLMKGLEQELQNKGYLDRTLTFDLWNSLYERTAENFELRRETRSQLYNKYKAEHSKRSAELCENILKGTCSETIIGLAKHYVENHECGGGTADFVMAADSISFMNCVSGDYIKKSFEEGRYEDAEFKVRDFMFSRLYKIENYELRKAAMHIIRPFYTLALYKIANEYLNASNKTAENMEEYNSKDELSSDDKVFFTKEITELYLNAERTIHAAQMMNSTLSVRAKDDAGNYRDAWPKHTQQGKYLSRAYHSAENKMKKMAKMICSRIEEFKQKIPELGGK